MRRARAAGLVAAVVFVGVFAAEDVLRRPWDPASMFVSELSLGTYGWIQRVSFVVTGVLLFVCARMVDLNGGAPRRSRSLRAALRVMGVCFACSAVFNTDPSALFTQRTPEGVVHGLLGAVVFLGMPTCCALVAAGAGDAPGRVRRISGAVGGVLVVGIALLKVAEVSGAPLVEVKGLVQRAVLVAWFGWLVTVAASRAAPASP